MLKVGLVDLMQENTVPNGIELSVVMPCLNEALTLSSCIKKANDFFKSFNVHGEVVIADNGSCDGSQDIALAHGAILVNAEERGYGNALIAGFKSAKGKYIIMGDADDSYDFLSLDGLVQSLRTGNDLVIGNRFLGGIDKDAMPFLHRYLGNPVLSYVGRLFFRQKTGDFHCGLRGISKDAFNALDLKSPGMEFASEMIVKASLKGYKIGEVPVKLQKDGRNREPHLRTWPDGWRHLKYLLLLCPRWLFFYPGIAMVILGITLSCFLIFGHVKIGQINFGIHTLFYASIFLMIGFQLAFFYFFSRIYWSREKIYELHSYHYRILKLLTFERGTLLGLFLIVLGIVISFSVFNSWQNTDFSALKPQETFKLIIPGGFAIMLGFQVFFSTMFLNLINKKA